jgi:hypothetical protein
MYQLHSLELLPLTVTHLTQWPNDPPVSSGQKTYQFNYTQLEEDRDCQLFIVRPWRFAGIMWLTIPEIISIFSPGRTSEGLALNPSKLGPTRDGEISSRGPHTHVRNGLILDIPLAAQQAGLSLKTITSFYCVQRFVQFVSVRCSFLQWMHAVTHCTDLPILPPRPIYRWMITISFLPLCL